MKITVLIENDLLNQKFTAAHGLCLYIETGSHRILFDFGPDDGYLRNAEKLEVSVEDVNIAFLSHGHKDHGGGIPSFLEVNEKAKIYVHPGAIGTFYSRQEDGVMKDIGIPEEIKSSQRIVTIEGITEIDDHLTVISDITGNELVPPGNETMYRNKDGVEVPDDFAHEQSLLIEEEGKLYLFSGCGHRGIVNIVEKVREIKGKYPDHVIGGFHIKKPSKISFDETYVYRLGERLMESGSTYHTCHCTGQKMFRKLNKVMDDKVHYIVTGTELEI
ncbi:MBL fold metallo-hydrolase [Proteiniclasticum sp.]|uniref:MBL fold metallo-hydrolase n=1 Tax=Proteiniclasticum sp. TaxID=2053595 RepID=UPI0028A006CC|nr:MBL fold metallo-hydrolase [Proteiniclasticum sp.]